MTKITIPQRRVLALVAKRGRLTKTSSRCINRRMDLLSRAGLIRRDWDAPLGMIAAVYVVTDEGKALLKANPIAPQKEPRK